MTSDTFQRKLTAILSADVVGYSRLMGDDEAATVKSLETYKGVMSSLIKQHRGRVVDSPGDNLLAEFGSVVDAVQCAVSIQKELQTRNADLPENRRMEFRIGINLGDVIEEEDRIYGDGVNIAARLEALADPGGICVSKTAFDHIESKLPLGYEFLGDQIVKNIAKPVGAYKVLMETRVVDARTKREAKAVSRWRKTAVLCLGVILILFLGGILYWNFYHLGPSIEPTSIESEQVPLALDVEEVPKTIAVLPFENLSSDKEQEYFSDGLADALITKLSQVKDLQITARTSSFYFKGKKVDMRTIGETLGVAYLLEGSVQKSENQLRIIAQLIKAEDGYHVWSETYDRELKDIFDIQDDIIEAVTTALSVTLGVGEFNRPGMTRNIEVYDEYLRACANELKNTPDSILAAIDHFKKALDIDPDFGLGWARLSNTYGYARTILPPGQTVDFRIEATKALKRAQIISPDMPEVLMITAEEKYKNGNWLDSELIIKPILEDYGHADPVVNEFYGRMLVRAGRNNDAIPYLQRAKRLDPLSSEISFSLSCALLNSKRINEALVEARRGQSLEGFDRLFTVIEFIVALKAHDRSKAADIINSYYKLEGDDPDATIVKLAELLLINDTETALSELKELSKRSDISPVARSYLAHVASELGGTELALESLRKSELYDAPAAIFHPIHSSVRQLPAFKTYVREIGLYDYWRNSEKWPDLCHPVGDDDFVCD
jgi:TolB-like protein/class 3 adenylate cyclase